MNKSLGNRIWEIAYPVLLYYSTITVGVFAAQLILGTENEYYMLCKIIGGAIAIPVLYGEYKKDLMFTGRYGVKPPFASVQIKQMLWISGITLCLSLALNNLISMSPLVEMSQGYQDVSDALYGSTFLLEFIGSALVTPLLEELVFRGVVYDRLRRRMSMWTAVIVSALIFGWLHFNIVQFIYAFLLGAVFALFREKTGYLYFAVFAHAVANGFAVIRTETGWLLWMVDGSLLAWISSLTLCFIGVVGLIIFIRTGEKEGKHE